MAAPFIYRGFNWIPCFLFVIWAHCSRIMALNSISVPFSCNQLLLCYCLLVQFANTVLVSASADTIIEGQTLGLSQTVTSSSGVFELGFFSPQDSTFYLGIWYKKIEQKTVVWVGNRELPLTTSSPHLTLEQGNLVIVADKITYSVSNISSARNRSLVLLDSGNLVLRDGTPSGVMWQSFDYPTDTFLPGMKLGIDKKTGKVWSLTAWKKENDPTPGTVYLKLNPQRLDEFVILRGNQIYWSSGSWDGMKFQNVPEMRLNYIFNFSFISNENISFFTYELYSTSILSRCVLAGVSGQLHQQSWLESSNAWNLFWAVPRNICEVYSYCGSFASCNIIALQCQCLEGFRPSDSKSWEQGDSSGGCVRKVPLQCEDNNSVDGEKDGFLMMPHVGAPLNPNITNTSGKECKSICQRDCSCKAYMYNGSVGCFTWSGELLNLKQLDKGGGQLYLKLAAYELRDNHGKRGSEVKIIVAATTTFILILLAIFVYCHQKNKQKRKREEAEDMQLFTVDMMGIPAQLSDRPTDQTNESSRSKDSWLPQFSFSSISTSTSNFSLENKLGEGGFGPVYKGKLLNGQEVAVKRLSRKSGQGLRELRNETTLIAKLQHRNLVRILGCCLEKGEKILIYELLPNGSLDSFLFDPSKRGLLSWEVRASITEGIAQGLLYLHEHSRLRIIHRDLKASNILLDKDMNPKISDFGLAKMFGGNESQAKTIHIVGTYGYMSPEYALEGLCSTKSDVFSFGVLMLEIISGKKNTGFYQSDSLNLLSYAWELWIQGIALQLVDPVLEDRCSDDKMMRYINVAFLCVHEIAANRPTMSEVVSMLVNENLTLPPPQQPAFSYLPGATITTVQPRGSFQLCSRNELTISLMEAR